MIKDHSTSGLTFDFLAFFDDLSANQNKEWFHANKARYEASVKHPMQNLLSALNAAFAQRGIPLSADLKRSISRINRDIRYSNDKSPYKDYISATLTRDPGEMSPGLIYLQFGKDEIFVGAGFYVFEPEPLTRFRQALAEAPQRWRGVTGQLAAAGYPLEYEGGLKRLPKGFEAFDQSSVIDDIKLKAFVCKLRFSPTDIEDPNLCETIAGFASSVMPLLEFGWDALGLTST